jgi:hypothetical protein
MQTIFNILKILTKNNRYKLLPQENIVEELYLLEYNAVNSTDVSVEHVTSKQEAASRVM